MSAVNFSENLMGIFRALLLLLYLEQRETGWHSYSLILGSDTAAESTCSIVGLVLIGCYSSHPVFDLLWQLLRRNCCTGPGCTRAAISCTGAPWLGWRGVDWHCADSPACLPTNDAKSPAECYCKIGPPPYLQTSTLRFKTTPLSNGVQ